MNSLSNASLKYETVKLTALLAFGIASPLMVHAAGLSGIRFLPIFFALSVGAAVLHPASLVFLAFANPLANHLLTGMPPLAPLPMLPIILCQSAAFGLLVLPFRKRLVFFMPAVAAALYIVQFLGAMAVKSYGGRPDPAFFYGVLANTLLGSLAYMILRKHAPKN